MRGYLCDSPRKTPRALATVNESTVYAPYVAASPRRPRADITVDKAWGDDFNCFPSSPFWSLQNREAIDRAAATPRSARRTPHRLSGAPRPPPPPGPAPPEPEAPRAARATGAARDDHAK